MKGKVLIFIIGLLLGAIIATGGFLFYEKTKTSENVNDMEQSGGPSGDIRKYGS